MSGRKACEVAAVLTQTEDVLNDIFSSYQAEVTRDLNNIKNSNGFINSAKDKIKNYQIPDIAIARQELRDEVQDIEHNIKRTKTTAQNHHAENSQALIRELNRIKTAIADENAKAAELRRKIQNRYDYVTAEYTAAQKVKRNIIRLKEDYRSLKNGVSSARNRCNKTAQQLKAKVADLEQVKTSIAQLDKRAKHIREIRNEANALKNELNETFTSIDSSKAKKFLSTEFSTLQQAIKEFNNSQNEAIIQAHSKLSANVNKLKVDSEQAYNEWLAAKNYSEQLLQYIQSAGEKKEIILLEDKVFGKSHMVSKLQYHDKYKKMDYNDDFTTLIEQAQIALNAEQFDEANRIISTAKDLYENAASEADNIRENLEASFNLAAKIRQIMLSDDINFRTADLKPIAGDPMNGFRLICTNGDTIDFEEIKFNQKGDLVVNLDHIEGTGGTCGVRWENMIKVFNNEGIPLTDVTKNGKSVVNGKKTKKTTSQNRGKSHGE